MKSQRARKAGVRYKRCPFCHLQGGVELVAAFDSGAPAPLRIEYAVVCVRCGARGPCHPKTAGARNYWNHRGRVRVERANGNRKGKEGK